MLLFCHDRDVLSLVLKIFTSANNELCNWKKRSRSSLNLIQ